MSKSSLSITQYAEKVGKTRQAIAWQCRNNKLPQGVFANKIGSTWVITLNTNR